MTITSIKEIVGVKVYRCEVKKDFRGENFEGYNEKTFIGCPSFSVDSFSKSKRRVLRGFHGDDRNYKLVSCLSGEIYLALADTRECSASYGKNFQIVLNERSRTFVLIPPGVLNAHQCRSKECIFSYKLSHGYTPISEQKHMFYNDDRFNFQFPYNKPITSERDTPKNEKS